MTQTIGIVGLGFLGRGIAACLLSRGLRVVGYAIDAASFQQAKHHIRASIEELIDRGGFDPGLRERWPANYVEAASINDFAPCEFVIESVFENLHTKRSVFDELETVVGDRTPIASNTSALPISLLQKQRKHPQRFIGMHWAEPCHLTRFLEVIRGEQTDDATVEETLTLARRVGKDPSLVRKDIEGFIVNRIGYAMYREAFHLLEQGVADVETIDKSVRSAFGLWAAVAGPFRWMDMSGVGAYAGVMKRLFPQLSSATEVPKLMEQMVAENRQGVSTGHGFYHYDAAEAQAWKERLRENVWLVRQLHEKHFPISDPESKD